MFTEGDIPHYEDFPPVDNRPACPICQSEMIHTMVTRKDGNHLHVWICDCEPQGKEIEHLIREIRGNSKKTTSLIIPLEDVEPEKTYHEMLTDSAMKIAVDALDYIIAIGEKTSAKLAKIARGKVDELFKVKPEF